MRDIVFISCVMMFNITIPTLKQSPLRGYKEMPAHQEAIKIDRCVFKLDGNGKDSEREVVRSTVDTARCHVLHG